MRTEDATVGDLPPQWICWRSPADTARPQIVSFGAVGAAMSAFASTPVGGPLAGTDVLNATAQQETLGYNYDFDWQTSPTQPRRARKQPIQFPVVVPMLGLKWVY